jgi:hypothetical protein
MYTVQRYTGKAWNDSMCSPYKSYAEAMAHVKNYSWHYYKDNPYRIIEDKPKKNITKRFVNTNWEGVVIV